VDNVLIGYFKHLNIDNGDITPCSWDKDTGETIIKCFSHFSLTQLKPKWYENKDNFPALVKHKDNGNWVMVSNYNKKGKCRILHSQKFINIDEYEFINKTKLLNFTNEHKNARDELVENLQKQIHNYNCDLSDYNNFTSVYRCPCCEHLVNRGNVCFNCGCDNGLFKDHEYSVDEIEQMKSKSKRIK
jgi:hypothetical protein